MRKIPTIFKRDEIKRNLVITEIETGTEWVHNGEGIATVKWDGTCCLIQDGKLYKRYDAKHGKTPPAGFIPAQEPDPITGHYPGWLLVENKPEDKYFNEGIENCPGLVDGTYELCGPKINANPEQSPIHKLVKHGLGEYPGIPRTFEGLKEWFSGRDMEGLVFHHPDGRMAKIKMKDFGLVRSLDEVKK